MHLSSYLTTCWWSVKAGLCADGLVAVLTSSVQLRPTTVEIKTRLQSTLVYSCTASVRPHAQGYASDAGLWERRSHPATAAGLEQCDECHCSQICMQSYFLTVIVWLLHSVYKVLEILLGIGHVVSLNSIPHHLLDRDESLKIDLKDSVFCICLLHAVEIGLQNCVCLISSSFLTRDAQLKRRRIPFASCCISPTVPDVNSERGTPFVLAIVPFPDSAISLCSANCRPTYNRDHICRTLKLIVCSQLMMCSH